MFQSKIVLVAICLFALVSSIQAEQIVVPTINVTATRTAQTVDESLSSVSVITREDIERKQPSDIVELLKDQVGIDVARSGGPGGNTSVFLRGGNSDHVLVMINGVKVSSLSTGSYAWGQLPISQIDRIEIVRGARTAQYGSEAITGVIHIFTRSQQDLAGSISGGSYGYRSFSVNAGDSHEGLSFTMGLSHESNEGFSAQNINGPSFNPDNDAYQNNALNLNASMLLDSLNQKLGLSFFAVDGSSDFDNGDLESLNQVFNLTMDGDINERWYQKLIVGWSHDGIVNNGFFSEFETDRYMLDWQNDVTTSENGLLTLGLNLYRDQVSSLDTFSNSTVYNESVNTAAIYAQFQAEIDHLNYLLALRLDDHENFGNESTGQFALGYQVTSTWHFTASYGTSFKAPDLNELYYPGFMGLFSGNENLKPETSETVEVGVRYRPAPNHAFKLSVYKTDVEDLIAAEGVDFQYINVDSAEIKGVELIYDGDYAQWHWSLAATWQESVDDVTGDDLLRRANEKFSADLSYAFQNKHQVGMQVTSVGDRKDIDNQTYQTITLPSFTVVNLFGNYKLDDNFMLSAKIENLFDENYEYVSGYNTPGLSGYLTLSYR